MKRHYLHFYVILFMLLLPVFSVFADDNYFSKTECQIHLDYNRMPEEIDIYTATFEHFSEWKFGDNFFFLDIESEPNFRPRGNTMYFEWAPRLSIDKILNTKLIPIGFMGDVYCSAQYNDGRSFLSSKDDFIKTTKLYGISFDFNFQPNYGFSNISIMVRDEDTQDHSWQLTFVWGQPFNIGPLQMDFMGFFDLWENDTQTIFLAEPQLRLNLSSFVGKGNFLSDSVIGTEIEVSHNFFAKEADWRVNPTIFYAFSF